MGRALDCLLGAPWGGSVFANSAKKADLEPGAFSGNVVLLFLTLSGSFLTLSSSELSLTLLLREP